MFVEQVIGIWAVIILQLLISEGKTDNLIKSTHSI
jgi:hypothetical protein